MQYSKFYILIVILISLISCNPDVHQKSDFLSVNVDDVPDDTIPVKLSEILETYEMIRFENSDAALLDSHSSSFAISEHYVVFRNNNRIMLFARDGKFIRVIGSNGRGPGEWMMINQMQIDEHNKMIIVNQGIFSDKLIAYGLDGAFIRYIPVALPKKEFTFRILNHDTLIFVGSSFGAEDSCIVFMQDLKGKLVNSHRSELINRSPVGRHLLYFKGPELFVSRGDTIFNFRYKTGELIPAVDFFTRFTIGPYDLYPRQTPYGTDIGKKAQKEPFNGSTEISVHFETDKYFVLGHTLFSDDFFNGRNLIYNKQDKKLFFPRYINDFWYNIPFEISLGTTCNSEYVYFSFSAYGFKRYIREIREKEKLTESQKERIDEMVTGINDNDSNILIICRIRQPH